MSVRLHGIRSRNYERVTFSEMSSRLVSILACVSPDDALIVSNMYRDFLIVIL